MNAWALLKQFGVLYPPVNPLIICEALGVKVWEGNFSDDKTSISYVDVYNKPNIIYKRHQAMTKIRFDVAYELGMIFHQNELDANKFAIELLLPFYMLQAYSHFAYSSMTKFSQLFGVSNGLMQFRLQELGVKLI